MIHFINSIYLFFIFSHLILFCLLTIFVRLRISSYFLSPPREFFILVLLNLQDLPQMIHDILFQFQVDSFLASLKFSFQVFFHESSLLFLCLKLLLLFLFQHFIFFILFTQAQLFPFPFLFFTLIPPVS